MLSLKFIDINSGCIILSTSTGYSLNCTTSENDVTLSTITFPALAVDQSIQVQCTEEMSSNVTVVAELTVVVTSE